MSKNLNKAQLNGKRKFSKSIYRFYYQRLISYDIFVNMYRRRPNVGRQSACVRTRPVWHMMPSTRDSDGERRCGSALSVTTNVDRARRRRQKSPKFNFFNRLKNEKTKSDIFLLELNLRFLKQSSMGFMKATKKLKMFEKQNNNEDNFKIKTNSVSRVYKKRCSTISLFSTY